MNMSVMTIQHKFLLFRNLAEGYNKHTTNTPSSVICRSQKLLATVLHLPGHPTAVALSTTSSAALLPTRMAIAMSRGEIRNRIKRYCPRNSVLSMVTNPDEHGCHSTRWTPIKLDGGGKIGEEKWQIDGLWPSGVAWMTVKRIPPQWG